MRPEKYTEAEWTDATARRNVAKRQARLTDCESVDCHARVSELAAAVCLEPGTPRPNGPHHYRKSAIAQEAAVAGRTAKSAVYARASVADIAAIARAAKQSK